MLQEQGQPTVRSQLSISPVCNRIATPLKDTSTCRTVMDPFVKEGEPVKQQPVEQQPPCGKKTISNIAQAQNAAPGGEVSPTHGEAITEHLVSVDHLRNSTNMWGYPRFAPQTNCILSLEITGIEDIPTPTGLCR